MNYNVTQALDQTHTGDLMKYFATNDGILEANSGVHDNKCLSIDASDPPCPVQKGMYTKLKLTDESIHITNIDKSSITAMVRILIKPTSQFWTLIMDDTGVTSVNQWNTAVRDYLTWWFVGLKSSSHLFDSYRVYSRNRKTSCEQTEALYENAAIRMLKSQEELDFKPGIYTQWKDANKMSESVCGTYFSLSQLKAATNNTLELEFEVTIPLDDFLPFSAMKMYPNCVFGNLTYEVKMAIQQNFVICQVDPFEAARKILSRYRAKDPAQSEDHMPTESSTLYNWLNQAMMYSPLSAQMTTYTKSFTQIGDVFDSCVMEVAGYTPITASGDGFFFNNTPIQSCFTITDGSLRYCRTNINGFNIKQNVIDSLTSKYSNSSLLIPSQYVDYQAFSQKPLSNGVKCNTTYAMTNVSALMFLFPRTSNEVTCSKNPHFASLQMQIDNKPYPDKPFSSLEHAHTIFNITNAGLDGLFSPNEEFGYSLIFNELGSDQYLPRQFTTFPNQYYFTSEKDNTSYCFLCSTERLSGYGTFCDGITKENAHVTLSGTLMPFQNIHPYLTNPITKEKNERSPIMLVCQDCFWKCTVQGGCEYICNNRHFVQEETGTN